MTTIARLPRHRLPEATVSGGREKIVWPFKKKKPAETTAPDAKVYYSTPFGDTKDGKQKAVFA